MPPQPTCAVLELDSNYIWFTSTIQVIGWEDRLRHDLQCVKWHVKPYYNQLLSAI